MRKKIALFFAATVAILMPALPASATPTEPEPDGEVYCSTWKMRGATGVYPDITFGDAPAGSSFTKDKAILVKAEGVNPGVEFATFDAYIELNSGQPLSVDYQLVGGASFSAGAVRMFYYTDQGADSLLAAPTAFVMADAASGTLTIPNVEKVGTLGLTYDGSNDAGGSVVFTNMKIGDMALKFRKAGCVTASPSPSASPTPTGTPTPDPEPSATETTAPPVAAGPTLPVTGSSFPWVLVIGGAVTLAVGFILLFAGAKKRHRIENS